MEIFLPLGYEGDFTASTNSTTSTLSPDLSPNIMADKLAFLCFKGWLNFRNLNSINL